MCAKADYREGFRVLTIELRRSMRALMARWRRQPVAALPAMKTNEAPRLNHAS
jgi:hypothetical protein